MGNGKRVAILAAGYLLGRTKTIKTAVLLAGGIAYGRMTAQGENDKSNSSLMSKFSSSPELQKISSGLAEAARGAVAATASKGMESLNENLQKRSAALRGDDESAEDSAQTSDEDSEEAQDAEGSDESEETQDAQDADDSKATSEKSTKKATKSGSR